MPDPVRVGFWSPVLARAGGTETWHSTLLPRLDPLRVVVNGMAILDPEQCDPVRRADIERTCPVHCGPAALYDLARNCDVIVTWGLAHPHQFFPAKRPKVVQVSHGDGVSWWNNSIMSNVADLADGYVCVSGAALDAVPANRRADAVVIHNAVDPERVRPTVPRDEQRARWGVPYGSKVVGTLMRLSQEKDSYALNRCLKHLPPHWVGVSVGDGEEEYGAIAEAYATLDTTRFRYVGPTLDVGSMLNAFDVLLFPSRTEGFGLTVVEAWLAGVPVVSTPVGIVRDYPKWVEPIPLLADGETIANAVRNAARPANRIDGCAWKAKGATRFHPDRFAREWSDYIVEVAV